jgi:undecaprenyl-diphosphatase
MLLPSLWIALILGVLEGLTEFLPVSSTGHLVVAGSLLRFGGEQAKLFEIVIQAGAILAVCWEYRVRLLRVVGGVPSDPAARRFVLNLALGFLPAAVLGFVFGHAIKEKLFAPVPVASALVVGALVIGWVERRQRGATSPPRVASLDELGWSDALKVGFAQAFALVPGTSRSGATIIGGMLFGLSRPVATELSFFLAIPTLFAATGYDLLENRHLLVSGSLTMIGLGFVTAFLSALVVVRGLIRYVARHDFVPFAWYRLVFGGLILATSWLGWVRWD